MIGLILTALSTLSDVKNALEVTYKVSRYITQKKGDKDFDELKQGVLSYANKHQALETTYKEWEQIAISLEPSILNELGERGQNDLFERAALLAELTKAYAQSERAARRRDLEPFRLQHSGFERTADGGLKLRLGLSDQTKYLSGDAIEVPVTDDATYKALHRQSQLTPIGGDMTLPVFKVTMLGDSGSGKTVFMSSMYAKMKQGYHQIAIKAPINVDLELGEYLENIFFHDKWPPGTTPGSASDLRSYDFELILQGESIARIDWVDYRGGAIRDTDEQPEGKALNERLKESHSIIWMVDMSRVSQLSYDGTIARLQSGMLRLQSLCLNAAAGTNHLRSVIFVRTKSDLVQNDKGQSDWHRACAELVTHLGPTLDFHNVPFCAAIPVSSVGRVAEDNDKKVLGDEPYNVEWPLILSLAFMLEADLEKLKHDAAHAGQNVLKVQTKGVTQLLRDIVRLGMTKEEQEALRQYSSISREIIRKQEAIGSLLKETPNTIKLYRR